MAELSDIGRKLIDEAMERDEPPPVDESWGTLVSRLTVDAPRGLPEESAPREEVAPPRTSTRWIAIAAIGMLGAVAFAWWWSRPPAPTVDATTKTPTTRQVPPAVATNKAPHKRAPEEPAVETLLADAEAALAKGDADRALALLERHAALAPIHPQAERRMALRVLVLCAKGDEEKARAEARAFLAGHPDSSSAAEIRSSCAGSE